ncbi:hypothetical protein QTP88_005433 [Uroleucon formosanum]
MYTVCYLWFIACSLLMTNANYQFCKACKFVEELCPDFDYLLVCTYSLLSATISYYGNKLNFTLIFIFYSNYQACCMLIND